MFLVVFLVSVLTIKKKNFFLIFLPGWVLVAVCSLSLVMLSQGSTYDPHKGRQIPNHWTIREVPMKMF